MREEDTKQKKRLFSFKRRQRYFVARELQISLAFLVILALLGGVFLQSVSKGLSSYFGLSTPAVSILLIIGYILIIIFLSILFSHRLVGPFKRLEYEMKIISKGEIARRLTVRTKDDLHVRNFIAYTNAFIDSFEALSKEYNMLNSTISTQLSELTKMLDHEHIDCEEIGRRIKQIQRKIYEFREHW